MAFPTTVGYTKGLVGKFAVEARTGDGFTDAVANFAAKLADPTATLLSRPILSPEEWIRNPYYSGTLAREMWAQKIDDFIHTAQGDITEVILTGSIGQGKTQLLKMLAAYTLYQLSCFKNPQQALGVGSSETLLFVLVSLNVMKARAKLLLPLRALIETTPYFEEHFTFDRKKDIDLVFPNHIKVVAGVTGEAAVHSEDVIFLGASEINFLPVVTNSKKKRGIEELDVAQDLVEATVRRMKTRFAQGDGRLPLAKIVLDSSREYPDSYLERRIRSIADGEVAHRAVVVSHSIWEAKRGVKDASGKLIYGDVTFPVEVGSDMRSSRILDESEVPFAQGEVVHVPVELRTEFERDIDAALRDLGGRAVLSLRQLFTNRAALLECIRTNPPHPAEACRHPWEASSTTLRDGVRFHEDLLVDPASGKPRMFPNTPRTIHVDVGLTTDALGISMACIAEMVRTKRGSQGTEGVECIVCSGTKQVRCARCDGAGHMVHYGSKTRCATCQGAKAAPCKACGGSGTYGSTVLRPRIHVDFMLKVTPPPTGEIQFDDVEALISRLRALGFVIPVVTADGTYSAQFLQRQVSQYGTPFAQKVSVDTSKDPYYALRDAIYDVAEDGERRLSFYSYEPVIQELFSLEDRQKKVDHPPKKSKDVADTLAGVVHNCENFPVLLHSVKAAGLHVKTWR